MTYYMYFIQTFIIRCTVSEILAEIDHKGPNWTFLTLKMTFRVIPYLSYFRAGLVSQQKSYMMQSIWAALRYYWIISIIMGKWAKPDLSDLENDLLNNSMKSISWQLINIIPKKLYTRNKEKLSNRFWENWQKVAKQPNLTFFYLSDLENWPLEWFNQIHILAVHQHPPWEASWQNREKVIKQFLRKLPLSGKWTKFDLSDL